MPAASPERAQVAASYLTASCYLPEYLDGVWHRYLIDWLLELLLMLIPGVAKNSYIFSFQRHSRENRD